MATHNFAERSKVKQGSGRWFNEVLPELGPQWHEFHDAVQQSEVLEPKTRELISIAAASQGRCPHCTAGHIRAALQLGADKGEIAEAMFVSALIASGTELHWMLEDYEELLGSGDSGKGRWFEEASPELGRQWREFHDAVYKESRLPRKTKELVAVAAACMGRCPHCTRTHIREALEHGADRREVAAALMVTAVLSSGTQLMWMRDDFEALLLH